MLTWGEQLSLWESSVSDLAHIYDITKVLCPEGSAGVYLRILCLFRCLKLFQRWPISDSPLPRILWNFWQFDLAFSLLFRYLLFLVVNVLCSLSEAFRCSGSRNIRRLKLLSRQVTMTLADGWWQFGRWMSRKCHTFQAVWKRNLVFCPSWTKHFISLSINLYPILSMSYKCTWKFLE